MIATYYINKSIQLIVVSVSINGKKLKLQY